ncbi:MAG: SRPBCC domain-containing protein [Rhodobacteraceae bacterium]|nr:SRPBCC domain-containing protein [Paracoccaceae bacterium]
MTLRLVTEGDRHVVVTRRFAAPPDLVYRAHVEPDLIRRWLTGPEGWVMTECVSDPRPGGAIRFAWADAAGANGFHLTGEYLEVAPGARILHVERMFLPAPTPDNRVETTFRALEGGTLVTLRMTLPDAETRAAMLATGMEQGMEASYARLEGLLPAAAGG